MEKVHDAQLVLVHTDNRVHEATRRAFSLSFAPNADPQTPSTNGTIAASSGAERGQGNTASVSISISITHSEVARWLLATEIGSEADTSDLAAAAEHVCQKLSLGLGKLVSSAGPQAVLSRALFLVRSEFPFLDGVSAGRAPDVCLKQLPECVHDIDANLAAESMQALIGTLLQVLAGLIGEDLTLRMVHEGWPLLTIGRPRRPGHSDGQEATS